MSMKVEKTAIPDVLILTPKVFGDDRGFFLESYNQNIFKDAGIPLEFVQDNHSRSSRGVLRGLHFQENKPQGKLVRVSRGSVLDVAVDLRADSDTFGKSEVFKLSDKNFHQLWIPPGFAHGFCGLDKENYIIYSCTQYRDKASEKAIKYNDKKLNIKWPTKKPVVSKKDQSAIAFVEFKKKYCKLDSPLVAAYALGIMYKAKAKTIYLVGFDGYKENPMLNDQMEVIFKRFKDLDNSPDLVSLTPTLYKAINKSGLI